MFRNLNNIIPSGKRGLRGVLIFRPFLQPELSRQKDIVWLVVRRIRRAITHSRPLFLEGSLKAACLGELNLIV